MKRPWMPFYVADYLQDTAHLSTAEHGAYLLLILHYWTKGGLPSEEDSIRRITRLSPRQWSQSRDLLKSFFYDGWKHRRVDQEIAKAIEKSSVNSANAKLRHQDRSNSAGASDAVSHPTLQTPDSLFSNENRVPDPVSEPVAEPVKPPPRAKPIETDWPSDYQQQFWDGYPRHTEKKAAMAKLDGVRKSGVPWAQFIAGVHRHRDQTRTARTEEKYIKHPTTWLNKGCWDDEASKGPTNATNRNDAPRNGYAAINLELRRRAAQSGEFFTDDPAAGAQPGDGRRDPAASVVGMDSGYRR